MNNVSETVWHKTYLQLTHAAPQLMLGIITLLIAYIVSVIVKFVIVRLSDHSKQRAYLFRMLGSAIQLAILLVGLVMALGTMGINVSALIASLGLVGFAVGFALKDTLSNLVAGFMVMLYQPFKAGDYIVMDKVEGRVVNVNLRYTVVRTDSEHTFVPNATILGNPLTVKDKTSP